MSHIVLNFSTDNLAEGINRAAAQAAAAGRMVKDSEQHHVRFEFDITVTSYKPWNENEEFNLEVTDAGKEALAQAADADAAKDPEVTADETKPKRGRPRKQKDEAPANPPPATDPASVREAINGGAEPEIRKNPENRSPTPDAVVDRINAKTDAATVNAKPNQGNAAAGNVADEPDWDSDEPEEPITKAELISLLNAYSSKHPDKANGAKAAMQVYGSTRITDISPGDWNNLAKDLREYIDTH